MSGSGDPVLEALAPWLAHAPGTVLLAVSGGPDSTALMHAAATLAPADIRVATVDHGLRSGSAAEAAAVARAAGALGLGHAILVWTGPKPAAGLQDAARRARYRLLAAHAETIGAGLILTAHTRDDQAETVLLRLAAGSGLAGLAGMPPERALAPGIRLGRPFLPLPKAVLVAWCEARGIAYARDPSNADPRFARARLRAAASALAAEGLTPARLARLAERAARDEAALASTAEAALEAATLSRGPPLRLDGAALRVLPDAVALRCLAQAMARIGHSPRRLERLEDLVLGALLPALRRGEPVRRTLSGLVVAADARGAVTLSIAPPRRTVAGAPGLLGKAGPPAYIGEACLGGMCPDEPAVPEATSAQGTARTRD
jgi:tRNA(Ile)-lysidine synthase